MRAHTKIMGLLGGAVWLAGCAGSGAPSVSTTPAVSATLAASAKEIVTAACEGVEAQGAVVEINLKTVSFAFDTDLIEGPRHCQPFVVNFTNNDKPQPAAERTNKHDFNIRAGILGPVVFDGQLVGGGGATIRYQVPALPAGEYYFYCEPHPGMHGKLVVAEQ